MSSLPIYVYVDVDDTIVRTASSKRIPMPAAIQHVRMLKEQGAILYCWSSGGADYARRSAEEFGIADWFKHSSSRRKPSWKTLKRFLAPCATWRKSPVCSRTCWPRLTIHP